MNPKSEGEKRMGALTTTLIAIAGIVLGWAAIEIVCRPCLQRGRSSLFKSLDPDYDPDDELDQQGTQRSNRDGVEEEQAPASTSIEDEEDEKKPLK